MATAGTISTGGWQILGLPEPVRAAERAAIGTTARVVVWPAPLLEPALATIDDELARLDQEVSRFQPGSEVSRIARQHGGTWVVSERLGEAVSVALEAARWTGGRVDPTVGNALVALGYDRDFGLVTGVPGNQPQFPATERRWVAASWRSVTVEGRVLRAPEGTLLDLGATAKALAAERAAQAVASSISHSGGVLVSLGGDISVAGRAPVRGWPVMLADNHLDGFSAGLAVVRLSRGGLATSSVTVRRWHHAGKAVHHIIDPRTGRPAEGPWRTVSVASAICVDADAASTAALVAGADAEQWLSSTGLPSRLVGYDGAVVLIGGWPAGYGQEVKVPCFTVCRRSGPDSAGGARNTLYFRLSRSAPAPCASHPTCSVPFEAAS